jgi:hypothetical protein
LDTVALRTTCGTFPLSEYLDISPENAAPLTAQRARIIRGAGGVMQLSDYVGQEIALAIPFIDNIKFQKVKLLGVEAGGIWIESQTLINMVLKATATATAPQTLAFFFPYHEVKFGFVGIEGPALNEQAFGL